MIWLNRLKPFLDQKVTYFTLWFLIIKNGHCSSNDFFRLAIFFISFIGIGVFGYITNDLSDKETDKLVGKTNLTTKLTDAQKTLLVLTFAILGFVPITFLNPRTTPLVVLEFILLLIYSFPPLRLKERGFIGVITDSFYAYFIPSLILLTYISSQFEVNFFFWFFFPLFSLVLGIRNVLYHQLEDYDNDIITQTKTFATMNRKRAERIKLVAIVASILIFVLANIFIINDDFSNFTKVFFLLTSIVYAFKLFSYVVNGDQKYLSELPGFDFIFYGAIIFISNTFIIKEFELLFFYCIVFAPVISKKCIYSLIGIMTYLRRFFSFIVNYSLYYFFLLVGINLKERAAKRKLSKKTNNIVTVKSTPLSEKIVHGLWIGTELSPMELLTITSFISNGYFFHLWTYQPLKNELPEGCICCDANLILSSDKIFRYKYSSQFGTGKGSYAGFSDIFRYKLLYDKGGWWVDMDVTCLKPFDIPTPYFFRKHHELPLVGNIMKAPKGSLVMKESFERAIHAIDENNRDWHKPINILYESVKKHHLEHCIYQEISNPDQWHEIKAFVFSRSEFKPNWYFIHWCNEVWRSNGLEKSNPMYESNYGQLLLQYNLITKLSEKEVKHHDRMMKFKLIIDDLIEFL